jgi:hypothetical protein
MLADHLPRLIVPRDHGALLAHPPLDQASVLVASNRQLFARHAECKLLTMPLGLLRERAKAEILLLAQRYLHDAGEPSPELHTDAGLLITGHQPELFHPGVWVKNFAVQHLAPQLGCVALNLIVDNDTAKSSVVKIPHSGRQWPIPFDHWKSEAPYEEHRVQDDDLFRTFAERASGSITWDSILPAFWRDVQHVAARTPLVGERFAAARRNWERRWGYAPLELPMSRLCESEAFAWFACHLLVHRERFREVHNAEIRTYRERSGIRSKNHPAPELTVEGDWTETPFWGWKAGEQRRQKLFVRTRETHLELRIGDRIGPKLTGSPEELVAAFQAFPKDGWKIRTRAFTTTLFSRLTLADLFVHGIGGGKYDEVVDGLLRRFIGFDAAPQLQVLSATLLLPLPRHPQAAEQERIQQRLVRDMEWNPQRHLIHAGEVASQWVRRKAALIESDVSTYEKRIGRFRGLREANAALAPLVADRKREAIKNEMVLREQIRAHQVNASREYAFCLFPEATLRDYFAKHFPPAK